MMMMMTVMVLRIVLTTRVTSSRGGGRDDVGEGGGGPSTFGLDHSLEGGSMPHRGGVSRLSYVGDLVAKVGGASFSSSSVL
jgi:hypothetical protein